MSAESVMPSNHLILCHPRLLLPSLFPSIRVFSSGRLFASGGQSIGTFSFSISPSNEYSGLISFCCPRNSQESPPAPQFKTSILWHSAFFIVKQSHPYMTIGKTIALTICTFVSKVIPLLFNMLSRSVITFLLRKMHLLILWLQSLSAALFSSVQSLSRV